MILISAGQSFLTGRPDNADINREETEAIRLVFSRFHTCHYNIEYGAGKDIT